MTNNTVHTHLLRANGQNCLAIFNATPENFGVRGEHLLECEKWGLREANFISEKNEAELTVFPTPAPSNSESEESQFSCLPGEILQPSFAPLIRSTSQIVPINPTNTYLLPIIQEILPSDFTNPNNKLFYISETTTGFVYLLLVNNQFSVFQVLQPITIFGNVGETSFALSEKNGNVYLFGKERVVESGGDSFLKFYRSMRVGEKLSLKDRFSTFSFNLRPLELPTWATTVSPLLMVWAILGIVNFAGKRHY